MRKATKTTEYNTQADRDKVLWACGEESRKMQRMCSEPEARLVHNKKDQAAAEAEAKG